jgi:tetratricopeptide (TPR) repeat protein
MEDGVFEVDRNTRDFAVGDYAVFRNALGVLYEDLADAARARTKTGGGAEDYFQAGVHTARSYGHFAWAEKWALDVPEHPYNMGNALYHMGRKREAMACYERAVKLKPRYAEALFNWGVAAYDLGDFQTAGWLFDRTLAADPDHAEAKHGRDYLLQQGRYFRSRNPAGPNER